MKTIIKVAVIILISLLNSSCLFKNSGKNNSTNMENMMDSTLTGLYKYHNIQQYGEYLSYLTKEELGKFNENNSINYEGDWLDYSNEEYLPYVNAEYMEYISLYIMQGLEQKGFKPISKQVFNARIKEVFGIDAAKSNQWLLSYKNGFEFCNGLYYLSRENNKDFFAEFTANGSKFYDYQFLDDIALYFFEDYSFFTQYRPDLDLVVNINGEDITPNLCDNFYHANQYVFYNSPSSLAWLKLHDRLFLFQLVRTYGYVKDKELLKWVLDNTKFDWNQQEDNFLAFSRILTHRRYEGKLHFNKEVIGLFDEFPEEYANQVLSYLEYIIDDRYQTDSAYERFITNRKKIYHSFSEQAATVAQLLYWGEVYSQKNDLEQYRFQFMGRFYDLAQNRNEYDAEFKRNNYYGLENFKELWEQAKTDRQGATYSSDIVN